VRRGWSGVRRSDHGGGPLDGGWHGVLQSAGLLFFAFAGYARVATLGEEVRDPERAIPRAILVALALALAVYLAVAVSVLSVLGPDGAAGTSAPLAAAVAGGSGSAATPVVRLGAAAASLGALLGLLAALGRTGLAMAREGDLPGSLATVHDERRVPQTAGAALAVAVGALVLASDLRGAIGFSSFGVLLYYTVANAAAFTQQAAHRRWPRGLHVAGAAGCLVLAAALPVRSILGGLAVVAAGVGPRACQRWRAASEPT